jgi:pentose-5-phosphate-3-epimerase
MPHVATLSAWIRSADLAHLTDTVKLAVPRADVFHDDIMGARSVFLLALGPVIVAAPRPRPAPILHGHLQARDAAAPARDLAPAPGWGS